MIRVKKLEEAFDLLGRVPGSSTDPPRIWSGEYAPFDGDNGKRIEGIRFYLIGSTAQMYGHVCDQHNPEQRNFYEVIYGRCHFYADYDLKTPSTTSVAAAHAAFSKALRKLLDPAVVADIIEHVLVAHVPGRKESMHVRWEFRSPAGALVVLSCPEDGRRLSSCAIAETLTMGTDGRPDYASSPLFFTDPETGRPACVLDYGVYNKNRNFRLAGNVKPKDPGQCRGWLVPAAQNAFGNGADRAMPSRRVFYENLVCYIPPDEILPIETLDVSEFPDILDEMRTDILGKHHHVKQVREGAGGAGGEIKRIKRDDATLELKTASQRRIEDTIENMLSAKAGEDVRIVDRRGGVLTMRIDGCECPIKGVPHSDANNGYYIVRMGYPMPRAYRRCWKTKCIEIQQLNPPNVEDLGENERYTAEAENLMKSTPASAGNGFLFFE